MLIPRVMPCLLLKRTGLVKTIHFKNPTYVGDPRNAVKIFNEKEVDELVFLDITATLEKRGPNFELIAEIASECFMPLGYGGGVTTLEQMERLFSIGVEKVSLNTHAVEHLDVVRDAAGAFGSQSVVVSIDVKKTVFGKYQVYSRGGNDKTGLDPVEWSKEVEAAGAGEILLSAIDRDGEMKGYDLALIRMVTDAVQIPVIVCGGAGSVEDFGRAVKEGGASAVAAGSLFVFHGRHRAVLINFPKRKELERIFS